MFVRLLTTALLPAAAMGLMACAERPSPADAGAGHDAVDRTAADATDSAAPPDVTLDARADSPPSDPCGEAVAPPWFEVTRAPHHVIARCAARDVHLWLLADATARVRYVPAGSAVRERSFALTSLIDAQPAETMVRTGGSADGAQARVCTPAFTFVLDRDGCRVTARDIDGNVLLEDAPEPAPSPRVITRRTPASELFYGFGEKTGALDRRGRRLTFRTTDAYSAAFGGFAPDADPLYLSVPFFVGLRDGVAYGLFTDVAYRLDMDMAATDAGAYSITSAGGEIDQYLVAGPRMPDVVRRYTALTGRAPLPPRWSLGYHQSRWGYSPASRLDDLASQFRTRRIPADALWLDIQHMDGFRTFTFDPVTFPDPSGLAARLAAQGFHLVVIADPGLRQDAAWPVYQRAMSESLVLRNADASPFVGTVWPGPSVFLDFTLPAARDFWSEQVAGLARLGVSGVWLDVNEPTTFPESGGGASVPDSISVAGDGVPTTMAEAHNVYALHQARATYEGQRRGASARRPFILTRAGYAGIQRYAAVWTGDAPSTWTSLRAVLPMLLGMGLSGVPFVGSDVGGYSGHATPELFARWLELGAYSPFFRGHFTTGVPDQEPWAFGEEVEYISRERIEERYGLLPYLYSVFDEASRTGAPVLRPMVYEFQDDPTLRRTEDQAMLGPSIMIAPFLSEGQTHRTVQLPAGRWFELASGAAYDGPMTLDVEGPLAASPVFAREGAILPRVAPVESTSQVGDGVLRVDLYPGAVPTVFQLYEDDGESFAYQDAALRGYARTTLRLEPTSTGVELRVMPREGAFSPPRRVTELWFHLADHAVTTVSIDGAMAPVRGSIGELRAIGSGFFLDDPDRSCVVIVPADFAGRVAFAYDPVVTALNPDVDVEIEVTVPAGTPATPAISIASDVNGWTQRALSWTATPGLARGILRVPRGRWFYYKFTRGDWTNVEVWPGCAEATNRYGFGAAHPVRRDTVFAWRDRCP